tara:strand:- start:5559 stop:6320 length:762 start_codon:yes stop_codon:yes gene_type:complete
LYGEGNCWYLLVRATANMPRAKPKPKKCRYDIRALTPYEGALELPQVQNCVATFSLGVKNINLKALSLRLKYTDYNPIRFAAMTIRLANPRTTALVFGSGNMVCTGSKDIDGCLLSCRKYVRLLQHAGVQVCFHNFRVQNIVASVAVPHPINLYELSQAHGAHVSYEPEMFPGMVLRIDRPKLVFLIFRSGKIVITGAKNWLEVVNTYSAVYNHIIQHFLDVGSTMMSSALYKGVVKQKRMAARTGVPTGVPT